MEERKTIYLCLAHMSNEGWEQKYVKEAFDTNWVVPMGPNVNVFGSKIWPISLMLARMAQSWIVKWFAFRPVQLPFI